MIKFVRKIYDSVLPYETRLRFYKFRHQSEYQALRDKINHSEQGDFSLKPFDENKCIFIHITKTAGTSVAKSLFNYLPYHYTAIDYRVIYGKPTFDRYFKFAFVRNPWDRLYSSYRYLKSGGWNETDRAWGEHHLTAYHSFDEFVRRWLSTKNIDTHIHFRPQHHFICDKQFNLLVDYLAYFETIDEDYNIISRHLDIDSDIGHHNANPAESYLNVYTDQTREIVAKVYAKDIALFGYQFDGIKHRTRILT